MDLKKQLATALVATIPLAACGGQPAHGSASKQRLPQGGEQVKLDPADFSTKIDNPYLPMKPGSRWIYRDIDARGATQRVEVTVTRKTKKIANGITARVIRDVATDGKQLVEKTFDWYAQDRAGNVWYLGEDTTEYDHGKPKSKKGSFEAGKDGAQPGVVMPAHPKPGMRYRQEHLAGQADDRARVFSTGEQAQVPSGHFTHALLTRESTPLEPRMLEYKLYAKGVGVVLALTVSGGSEREELIRYSQG